MILFRAAKNSDLDDVYDLAKHSGVGLTTLSKDRNVLEHRLLSSTNSFTKDTVTPGNEQYFFVLEDTKTHRVVGTSAIKAQNGIDHITYGYKHIQQNITSQTLNKQATVGTLHLKRNHLPFSELCTLYLAPEYRHHHHGILLSRARFLYVAQHPHRFTRKIIAEMRGLADDNGISPFWDAVGQHFFDMSFKEADHHSSLGHTQFIEDLMPKYPLYVNLLPQNAQDAIGVPHPFTKSAMRILMNEGFYANGYVDIFDAGPTLEAFQSRIKTIRTGIRCTVASVVPSLEQADSYLIANTSSSFCACIQTLTLLPSNKQAMITEETAELLAVKCGDTIYVSSLA